MFRQKALSAALAATLALGMATQTFAGQTYTREEAIKVALENSSDVKSAEEALTKTNAQVDEGYGNAYPSIDLSATVTRIFGLKDVKKSSDLTKAAQQMAMGQDADGHPMANAYDQQVIGPALDGLIYGMKSQGYRWQSSIGLTATQVLYAGGKVGTGIEIAKTAKLTSEIALENTKNKVRYDVEEAFDNVIILDSSVVITEESIALLQTAVDLATQSFQSGLGKELDVVRAQLELDNLKSTLEDLKKKQVLARNAILNTMGLPFDAEVKFIGDFRNPENATMPDTAMANVLKRRKEIAQLKAAEEINSKLVEIEEGDYKPTVALVAGLKYSNNKNEFLDWDAPDWDENINKYIALSVTMNLFNGNKTKSGVAQAKSDLRTIQLKRETAERGFRLQIESCVSALENATQQIEMKKRSLELSQKNYDLTEAAYKVGRETQINYLTANNSLRQAKLAYTQAIKEWNTAYNALLQATGEY
ncbi:TolC family protein [Fibrobacter sp. UWEL]|uniref:TolC family protein n=1 Tax=Fibrobacter sp. UWEL TaxID=1896209 RepID=UPI000922E561|nr:TolC family protein [Fibrobacter sp. UWEL]SHL28693.1 outer membrane factor, OMF family [Fibrobacter sp. UWEL]